MISSSLVQWDLKASGTSGKTTSRTMFQRLAKKRLEEAKALYSAGLYDGAYYLAGYVVECAIKAIACKQFQRHSFPNKRLVIDMHEHDLEKLMGAAGLKTAFTKAKKEDTDLDLNWAVVRDWGAESRYQKHSRQKAKDFIEALDGPSGVLSWLEANW